VTSCRNFLCATKKSVLPNRHQLSHVVAVAIALRTYRFIGEGAVAFLVQECADRSRVLVGMAGDRERHKRCQLLLSAADWRQLCTLHPFGSRATRTDAVTLELQFIDENDYGDSLMIARASGCEGVSMRMQCGAPGRRELSTELSRWQWRYLTALDVVGQPNAQARHANRRKDTRSRSSLLRVVHRAKSSIPARAREDV
jgi:hypothetical protein